MEGLSYRESTVILATVQSRKQLSYSSNMHSFAHVRGKKEKLAVKMLLGFRSFKMNATLKIISTTPKSLEFNILCFAVMLKPTCTYR